MSTLRDPLIHILRHPGFLSLQGADGARPDFSIDLGWFVLFAVYARALRVADLSVVTIGWVVFLQVGLLLIDRFRYDLALSPPKWAAVAAILVLQGYLVLGDRG